MSRGASILYVGPRAGTCLHRAEALRTLGHRVVQVAAGAPAGGPRRWLWRLGHRLRRPPDVVGSNAEILARLAAEPFDLLWVDKDLALRPQTLERARELRPALVRVTYSPDDMSSPDLQSERWRRCVPLYELHVTTKSFNVAELPRLGARDVLFVDNGYDPATHRPVPLDEGDRRRFASEVGFVGSWEPARAAMMLRLAREGLAVTVHGPQWERQRERHPNLAIRRGWLEGADYAKAVCATKINLGFLRKAYRDLQTTRSVEIPACGGFFLGERTAEHRRLFVEGVEAEFFEGEDELLAKCRHYLTHEGDRSRVAAAGRRRCLEGGYDNAHRLAAVFAHLARSGALRAGAVT